MNEVNNADESEEIITPEGWVLRPRPRPSTDVTIRMPLDVVASIEGVAAKRNISREALIRFYVGQGLRQDLYPYDLLTAAKQVLSSHFQSEEEVAAILKDIQSVAATSNTPSDFQEFRVRWWAKPGKSELPDCAA